MAAAATPKPRHVKMRDDQGKLYDIHPDEVANSSHLTPVADAAQPDATSNAAPAATPIAKP